MSHFTDIFRALRTKPGYTLMRGMARFGAVRTGAYGLRRMLHDRRMNGFFASCASRFDESFFAGIDREDMVARLRRDGVAFGLRLPEQTVRDIVEFANSSPVFADRKPQFGFRLDNRSVAEAHMGKPILVAQYFNTEIGNTTIKKLSNDPVLWWIAGKYLGCVPRFVGVNLWWTFPVKASEEDRNKHAHLFHRDVDDFRFFKFFFYLTPVELGDGAHVCVASSHDSPPHNRLGDPWNLRRYSDEEIAQSFPPESIVEICGPAGTGFAENTLCVHKGLTPVGKPRLLLQLQFAFFDYGVMHDRRDPASLRLIDGA